MERWAGCLIICALLLLAVPSIADEMPDLETLREERDEKIERYFVRALTQKRLSTATELLEEGQYTAARKKLEEMKFSRLNPYERALAYRFLAYASVGQEDSAAAVGYFEKVVEQAALAIDDEASVRFSIAQIYASMGEWQKVEEELREWFFFVDRPNAVAYYLLAISHYRREQYDEALTPALKALETSNGPKETWLQLVAALYLQRDDFDSAVPILEELLTRFPKKQYWVQLSLIYGAREDYEHALQIQQLAYAQGLLTQDDELRRLARTYLFHQLPHPAAQVLERGLEEGRIDRDREVLELLGNSWIAAREYEKAIEPLQRAAELAEDGRLYLRLGQVRVQREDWKEATGLLQKAIKKGGLDDAGKAHLLLGISYFSDDHPESARTAFQRAWKHESTRTEATAWLQHIDRQSQDG
ncbi:MAG: tetratricopeptide repeat protein [Deltaproteobacteria bacterium]|nr:tetratricopeptide repeat protein [Deltaproteobacteria bacterium]MBW2398154.1 tetratricopeptide repeat protein [Deltaproteobacteria bacterium]